MSDLSWEKALRVQGFSVTPETKAAGWPDTFTVRHLALLQYPAEGTDAEKSTARKNQSAIVASMTNAIELGQLKAEKRIQKVEVTDDSTLFRRIALSKYGISRGWYERDFPERIQRSPSPPTTKEVQTWMVTRLAFRDWLDSQGEEPSEHIRAWLRPLEQADESKAKTGRKPSKAREHMARILDALKQFAQENDESFDRYTMPGPHGEGFEDEGSFHWMCAQLFREFRCGNSNFRNRQHNGLCSVQPYAQPTDFYRRALPVIAQKLGVKLNVRHLHLRAKKTA